MYFAKNLIDPKRISKQIDSEGRSEIANRIWKTRRDLRTTSEIISLTEIKLEEIRKLIALLQQQKTQAKTELSKRLGSCLVKIMIKIGIRDKQATALQEKINAIGSKINKLYNELYDVEYELRTLRKKQAEIPNPKQLLEAYYEEIATQPLTNEQKRELLKPEILASLTTEEYIALWRRLNPYFLAHVTRQGFRDHNAMIFHSAGLNEFHNGFLNVMQDGRLLRPSIALTGLKNRDEASVRQWLSDWVLQAKNENEAKERLNNLLHFHLASAPKYPDKTAVHFAAQIVADDYYGGEKGNEVFFVYPSDVLVSQYTYSFNGKEKDLTKPQSETKWNDVFIWTDPNNPGIHVDSGIVFYQQ